MARWIVEAVSRPEDFHRFDSVYRSGEKLDLTEARSARRTPTQPGPGFLNGTRIYADDPIRENHFRIAERHVVNRKDNGPVPAITV